MDYNSNGFQDEPSRESRDGFRPVEQEPVNDTAYSAYEQPRSEQPTQQTSEEPRTPYQTPVRGQAGQPWYYRAI